MSDVWEHTDRTACTHPGWATLHGWAAIASSFFALFQGGQGMQFILTGERVQVVGDLAWVSLDEDLLDARVGGTVAALNVFARAEGRWWMVVHHGSPVAAPT
jgi:ketosteroid isomerase-like protein